jgi:ubiquinone/menaquinone biosynthesis C-methylase UbiE
MELDVMIQLDVTYLPFIDNTFDVIICNHVLEHVTDDLTAMSELFRILKPGSWAVLQVPIALNGNRTVEDENATTVEQRIELFGQSDHVRLYCRSDYENRLKSVGFQVTTVPFPKELSEEEATRYALITDELVFFCSKPLQ